MNLYRLYVVAAEVSPADVEIVFQDLGNVGVIIAGDVAKEEITEALVKALVLEGVSASSISLSYVPDMGVLPYAALTLAKTVKLVVAASAVTFDPKGSCVNILQFFQNLITSLITYLIN